MIGIALDYAMGRISGADLAAAGITTVVRYVGIGGGSWMPSKRLTKAEYEDLRAHGITVLASVENSTTDADGGYAQGVANARAALTDANIITSGAGLPVFFANNDKNTYTATDVEYVRGFRDVLGVGRTGAYGFGPFLAAVHTAGHASVFWQCGEPPDLTGTQGFVHMWQRQGNPGHGTCGPAVPTTMTIAGTPCDIDNCLIPLPTVGDSQHHRQQALLLH